MSVESQEKKTIKQRLISIFDSRATWASLGAFAGTFFGGTGTEIVNAIGSIVMAIL